MVTIERKRGGKRPNSGGKREGSGRKKKGEQKIEAAKTETAEIPMLAGQILPITKGKNLDPKNFLIALMHNEDVDVRLRLDAARTLMPYTHQKLSTEKPLGKKEQKAEAAKKADKGSEWAALLQ